MKRLCMLFVAVSIMMMLFVGCSDKSGGADKSPNVNVFEGQEIICRVSEASAPAKAKAFADVVNNRTDENKAFESGSDYILEFLPTDDNGGSERFALWIADDVIYVSQEKTPEKAARSQTSAQQWQEFLNN